MNIQSKTTSLDQKFYPTRNNARTLPTENKDTQDFNTEVRTQTVCLSFILGFLGNVKEKEKEERWH